MQLSEKKIKLFQQKILTWYEEHKRSLPWRDVPYGTSLQERAYMTLVSEVMSQQTQITRVVPKFEIWMNVFPTAHDLAQAKVSDVLHHWSGLGYNRRALNLKKTAEIISKTYNGQFPRNEKQLLELPGIGKYTARAIMCFAFDEQVAVVDTNVRKVILTHLIDESRVMNQESRKKEKNHDSYFILHDSPGKFIRTEKEIEEIAQLILPVGRAYDWNQALMDYAAAVLRKSLFAKASRDKEKIRKQSKFHGSRRYYRGQVLKYLLKHKKVALAHLGIAIKEDFTMSENEWLQKLVQELTSEGFIVKEQGMVVLAS